MSSNKNRLNWSSDEDDLIRYIHEDKKVNSWKKISKQLNKKNIEKKRSPKQCRQRYVNHIKFKQNEEKISDWSQREEKLLFEIFLQNGPKWVKIALSFPGKSENSIKNKFYGTLRKFLRKMNKIQKQIGQKGRKQIKYECLLKFINLFNPDADTERVQKLGQRKDDFINLRQNILRMLATFEVQEQQKILDIALKLHNFSSQARFLFRSKIKNKLTGKNQSNDVQQSQKRESLSTKSYILNQPNQISQENQQIDIEIKGEEAPIHNNLEMINYFEKQDMNFSFQSLDEDMPLLQFFF